MSVKGKKQNHPDASTQRYLPFSQIRENVLIMKDGSARIVMECSSINFLLKNTDEQDSIIIGFQRFLNSLDFPIQIIVRSKKLDIDAYLEKLNRKADTQENELLKNQTVEYIDYLRKLVEVAQIMKKEFYIIIPFDENDNKSVKDGSITGVFTEFWQSINGSVDIGKIRGQIQNFSKNKKGLVARSNAIKTGLENIGIKSNILEKTQLVKFLTHYYNPTFESSEILSDIENYDLINK